MTAARAGRPRDPSLDTKAIAATRELLIDEGFDATTMQAIAKRSGVHASALYRRWPSRIELIQDAIFPGFEPPAVAPTGDLRADLHRFLEAYLDVFESPATRAATPGLMAHHQSSRPGRPPEHYLRVSARPQLSAILAAAPAAAVDATLDPDDVFDMLLGAVLARTLVPTIAARRTQLERTVDLLVRMVRPDNGSERGRRRLAGVTTRGSAIGRTRWVSVGFGTMTNVCSIYSTLLHRPTT